jgi:biotin transporter BioY
MDVVVTTLAALGPPKAGAIAAISDSSTNLIGAPVLSGGGSFTVLVWSNGKTWTVIGS